VNARASARRRSRGTGKVALLALALISSCWTPALRTIPETRSPYDVLPTKALDRLAKARDLFARGEVSAAADAFRALAHEYPKNVPTAIWLQEAEIAAASPVDRSEELRERYRKIAELEPTAGNLVLAARVEPDAEAARVLLERAGMLDRACPWPAYGRAWLAASAGEWAEVRRRIAEAKAADPGHMPTLWLETWLLARSGGLPEAITSLGTWIEKARDDPRIDPRLVNAAVLDRALLAVLDKDPKLARELLAGIEGAPVEPARKSMIEAGAYQELGDGRSALASAEKAEAAGAGELLPLVQQALLHEVWLGDPKSAEEAWKRAIERSQATAPSTAHGAQAPSSPASPTSPTSPTSIGSLLERVRARVNLERMAAARAKESAAANGARR
jgi:hypothetical protein